MILVTRLFLNFKRILSYPVDEGMREIMMKIILSSSLEKCWINFQCRGVLLIWIIIGQWPTALAVGGGGLAIFSLIYHFSFCLPLSGRRPDID